MRTQQRQRSLRRGTKNRQRVRGIGDHNRGGKGSTTSLRNIRQQRRRRQRKMSKKTTTTTNKALVEDR